MKSEHSLLPILIYHVYNHITSYYVHILYILLLFMVLLVAFCILCTTVEGIVEVAFVLHCIDHKCTGTYWSPVDTVFLVSCFQ